jgi:hypothetical protein
MRDFKNAMIQNAEMRYMPCAEANMTMALQDIRKVAKGDFGPYGETTTKYLRDSYIVSYAMHRVRTMEFATLADVAFNLGINTDVHLSRHFTTAFK